VCALGHAVNSFHIARGLCSFAFAHQVFVVRLSLVEPARREDPEAFLRLRWLFQKQIEKFGDRKMGDCRSSFSVFHISVSGWEVAAGLRAGWLN